jgi:hypothetical protein
LLPYIKPSYPWNFDILGNTIKSLDKDRLYEDLISKQKKNIEQLENELNLWKKKG